MNSKCGKYDTADRNFSFLSHNALGNQREKANTELAGESSEFYIFFNIK